MPEIAEVEVLRRQLESSGLLGKRVDSAENVMGVRLRTEVPSLLALQGATLVQVRRRAKYLGFIFSNGKVLVSHLGMSGMWNLVKQEHRASELAQKHKIVALKFNQDDGFHRCVLMYSDPRKFGSMDLIEESEVGQFFKSKNLGVEPLRDTFTAQGLTMMMQAYSGNMKKFLMDQSQVCGLGNIYANEVLFRCKIHPGTPAKMARIKARLIHTQIREVLQQAIEAGGSTIHSYSNLEGEQGSAQRFHMVYGREGLLCVRTHECKSRIRRSDDFDGRGTFWCPNCQKPLGS